MSDLTRYYEDLLIKQYWEKPQARAEIVAMVSPLVGSVGTFLQFKEAFDLDQAVGDQLDIIGKIVGASRIVDSVVPKIHFGFDGNPNARGFASKFDSLRVSAPFYSKFQPAYTALQLDDDAFRFYIRARIASNAASAYMVSDDRVSVQDVINTAFDGLAYVIDRQDMSLSLYVSVQFDESRLRLVLNQNLLPKPQGVRYAVIVQATSGETFGFSNNPNAKGFASKFDPSRVGGVFARKVII